MYCTVATDQFNYSANSQSDQTSTAATVCSPVRRSVGPTARRSRPAPAPAAARRGAATWQAAGTVLGPDNSLERREGWPRPSWDRAISRVRGSLREQRGEGCLALCELHVPCVAGSPRPAGHVLTWQGCTLLKHSAGRFWVGTATVRSEKVFLSGPSRSACARAPPGRADHARWAAGTLLYKHTYNSFSGVVAPAR